MNDVASSIHDPFQLVGQKLNILLPIRDHLLPPRSNINLCLQLLVSEIFPMRMQETYFEDLDKVR
jgi:hypothetical protein